VRIDGNKHIIPVYGACLLMYSSCYFRPAYGKTHTVKDDVLLKQRDGDYMEFHPFSDYRLACSFLDWMETELGIPVENKVAEQMALNARDRDRRRR
jgi:hypothetical protein